MTSHKAIGLTTVILAAAALNAYADADEAHMNRRPIFVQGPILHNGYDGASDDLLTGGLGKTGLQALAPPDFADPLNPTAAELRVRTIYNNYRALLDMTVSGGYGVLHGPNIDVNGNPTLGEGKIAGDEYLAYADQGGGKKNVTMMVQVPASFDPNNPCIVAGPSSGSRGVYGAIASAGDWGLKHGCAVAYTDKGTGTGFHDLQANTVNLINGLRADADAAGKNSNFTAKLSVAELAAFDSATPNRFAVKHAHSQQNPEKDWGQNVLQSIEFAFYVLNQQFADRDGHHRHRPITKKNTIVIASSLSNGGNASLAAAEQDTEGLIDGVAVGEPAVQLPPTPALTIKRGTSVVTGGNKGLLDFVTLANLYQPCAALAPGNAASPGRAILINAAWATNRCALLKAKGLLTSATLVDQANESQAVLNANGWESESNLLQASHFALASQPLGVNYANAYGRFHVTDNLCGFSYGATSPTTGTPVAIAPVVAQQLFASSTGVVPTGGVNLINNNAVGGPILDAISVSPGSGVQDYNLDGALCLRSLTTGVDPATGMRLTGVSLVAFQRVRHGIAEVRRSGDLHGKPAIIVHGRSDALVPVNHSSRPYYGVNKLVEGNASRLSYIEVTNAQHFDAFIGNPLLAGYDTRFVPTHHYWLLAMDLMYSHLKKGTPLPPSQVVRTVPRGGTPGAAPAISIANVPPIQASPASTDRITFSADTLTVPD